MDGCLTIRHARFGLVDRLRIPILAASLDGGAR